MADPAVVAAWAAVFAALIGPVVGVRIAHIYSRQESRRTAVSLALRTIMENAIQYSHSCGDQLRFRLQKRSLLDQLDEMEHILDDLRQAPNQQPMTAKAESLCEHMKHELLALEGRHSEAFQRTRMFEASLNGDRLAISILFEPNSGATESCGRAMNSLILLGEMLNTDDEDLPNLSRYNEELSRSVFAVSRELKAIHEKITKEGMPDDLTY